MNTKAVKMFMLILIFSLICSLTYALDKTITIPAEKSQGITMDLPAGDYTAEIAGGAISLFFPIHPHYQWLYGLAIGTDVEGGQDMPNIGTLYFEPKEKVFTQAEAEELALEATTNKQTGTTLSFTLKQDKKVRFWVSDFDYTDNTGSERVRIYTEK
ncbi:MAG: hypothetical protein ABIH08_00225 [Candidatus Omnitrophota bacterium]